MVDFFLDGSDAARIFAVDHIDQLGRFLQLFLFYDHTVPDDIDGDVRVHVAQNIQIQIDHAFDLDDVFVAMLVRASVANQGDTAIQLVQASQIGRASCRERV